MHVHDTIFRIHLIIGRDVAVFQSHHDGGRLESRPGLHEVAHRGVPHLVVVAVAGPLHVHVGLHFTGGHFHHHGHTVYGAQVLQLVGQGFLGNVLDVHVDGRDDITAIDGRLVHDAQELVHHLLAVDDAVLPPQEGVVGQLQSVLGPLLHVGEHVSQRAPGQRAERLLALIEGQYVEPAFISRQVEDRQLLHFLLLQIGDTFGVNQVVAALLLPSGQQVVAEFLRAFVRENGMQALADFREVIHQHRVFLRAAGQEVHVDLVFRQAAGHQFSVRGDDVAARRMHRHVLLHEAVGHFLPVLPLAEHDDGGFHDDGNGQQRENQHEERVAQHDVFLSRYHLIRPP